MRLRNWIYAILLIVSASMIMSSCYRDDLDAMGTVYVEGRPTALRLRIGTPSMNVATRSDMPAGKESEINSLWIGIFSVSTGECTFARLYRNQEVKQHLKGGGNGSFSYIDITDAVSGNSYIVAVGNPEDNFGYQHTKGSTNLLPANRSLVNILPQTTAAANPASGTKFTWESYKNVAIRQLELGDVNAPIGNLVMSGIYTEFGKENADPESGAEWEKYRENSVNIPAVSAGSIATLDGAVHLRRLISQVKFNIWAVDYNGTDDNKNAEYEEKDEEGNPTGNRHARRVIEIIPQSFQVRNVPYTSWLHERKSPDEDLLNPDLEVDKLCNSGDVIRVNGITYSGNLPLKRNYRNSSWFNGNQYLEPKTIKTSSGEVQGYTFDFWMLENKRRALRELGKNDYDLRELEAKEVLRPDDPNDPDDYEMDRNTGIYTALCDGETEIMNNCATFVEIRCRVVYTDEGLDAITKDEVYEQVQYRSAEAIYTIHLGGIGNDWSDFTHRRNHRYIYNVTVMDIDRIIVEARFDEETRPGTEGVVTDVVNPPFEVDCHYGWVNIQLSNLERAGGGIDEGGGNMNDGSGYGDEEDGKINGGSKYKNGRFPFRIRYYDETNFAYYIDEGNIDDYMTEEKQVYWNWIELRPTSGPDVIAEYKPYSGEGSDGKTFRLLDIADLEHYAHDLDDTHGDPTDTEQRWYTVFINEYVYETSTNENNNNWRTYVNLSPRMCWLNTLFRSSRDDESNYIRSKYVVRQQSIETFYAIPEGHNGDDINAIGMETLNESFGFNLRWDDVTTRYNGHTLKNNNGRHNTLLYLLETPQEDGNGFYMGGKGDKWENYVNPNKLQYIEGINRAFNQYNTTPQLADNAYLAEGNPDREPYYVPELITYTGGNRIARNGDVNTTYFLRILDACMNRNRDNNGNGIIDPDEIRWYVPASSEMIDLVLGRNSLENPLLDYGFNTSLNSPAQNITNEPHQANTRFHYGTSNQRTLWAEEGATINPEADRLTGTWNLPPLHVRCVRALGTDLSTDENNDMSPAFTTNAAEMNGYPNKIFPTYYDQKNQRSYSPDALEPHQEMTTLNRLCHNGFEFDPLLYDFSPKNEGEPRTATVRSEEKKILPAGYYEDGDYEKEYLGTDRPADPEWIKENNAVDLEGKPMKTETGGGYYYKAIPGSLHGDWVLGNLRITEAWTETILKQGWYLLDMNKCFSWTKVDGSIYLSEFWVGGTTHEEGYYLPDLTRGPYEEQLDGTVLWENYRVYDEVYPEGYYWPDTSAGPSEELQEGYEYFPETFGDKWNPSGNYWLIASTRTDEYVWGYASYNSRDWSNGLPGTGYYEVDFNRNRGGVEAWVPGFWSGDRHDPGYYPRGTFTGSYNIRPDGFPESFPRFNTSIYVGEGTPYPDGYYYADEKNKGVTDQPGYKYYKAWNEGGEYYPAGWYGFDHMEYSQTARDGYTWFDAITMYNPAGRYDSEYMEWSETRQPGYGQIEDGQPEIKMVTKDFIPGYYADGGYGRYLGTTYDDVPVDPAWKAKNPQWLSLKAVGTDEWTTKTVEIGPWGDGDNKYLFNFDRGQFVQNHGATLEVANQICEEKKGRGWRMPNLKEAALIKIAMENAGIYKRNGLTWAKDTDGASGYEIGNFLSCTYREYGIQDGSREDDTGYYTGVYFPEAGTEVQQGDWQDYENGPLLGRICCITTGDNRHYYIRCVRDLETQEDPNIE